MAERRMFAKTIIDSDAFLDMPQSTQNLYFHLSMRALDKGIINNVNTIARIVRCDITDINTLVTRQYIYFKDTLCYITHWYENNGIGETARKRNNYAYRKWRSLVLERDNFKCIHCGSSIKLNAHHIQEFSKNPTSRLDIDNGITLCYDCHRKEHNRSNLDGD